MSTTPTTVMTVAHATAEINSHIYRDATVLLVFMFVMWVLLWLVLCYVASKVSHRD